MPDLTDVATIPHAVNNHYDRKMLEKAVPLFVYQQWAQTRDIPRGNTNVIKFTRFSLLTAATTPLTEGVTPTGSKLSVTRPTATVLQYGDFIQLSDVLMFTTLDPILMEMAGILGLQYQDTLDQLARDILAAGTTIQYPSSATARNEVTAAMKITKLEIQTAVKTLKNNNAKRITEMVRSGIEFGTIAINQAFIGIVHPSTTFDLKNIAGFMPVEEYGNKKALTGEIGALDEVRFIETTNAKVFASSGSGSIDVYATIILGADAYARTRISGEAVHNIIKPLGSGGAMDPLNQRQTSGWKASYIALILNESFMLRFEHAVT